LNEIEEMLVARAYPYMKIYRLKNGQTAHQGGCLNVEQEVTSLFDSLPSRPADIPVVIVRMQGKGPELKDFRVRRGIIQAWLRFLKKNHPMYADISINDEALMSLPEDGSILNELTTVDESDLQEPTSESSSNEPSVAAPDANPPTLDTLEEEDTGPEQAGASGVPVTERGLPEEYLGLRTSDGESEDTMIRSALRKKYKLKDIPTMAWPERGSRINDYNTPGLQSILFPSLFPFGLGDSYNEDRRETVTMTEASKHLLNYALANRDGSFTFPFAEHPRWKHWAQSTVQRHREVGQRNVYVKKHRTDGNLTELELQQIVRDDGSDLRNLISRMQRYNGNINGTNQYLYKSKRELESLIEAKGMPTFWFTWSAADNHWEDLHRLLYPGTTPPTFGTQSVMDELKKALHRRKLVRKNPHLVDEYFLARAEEVFKTFLTKKCINIKYHWFRIEYQKRGMAHVHGCCRLKNDPGIPQLGHEVLNGRIAERELGLRMQLPQNAEDRFEADVLLQDEWLAVKEDDEPEPFDEAMVQKCIETIRRAKAAESIIGNFHDWFLSTMHPDPPVDASLSERVNATKFKPNESTPHPTTVNLEESLMWNGEEREKQYCQCIDAVQRHVHCAYCLRKGKCRSNFPHEERPTKSHLKIRQFKRSKQGDLDYRLEMIPIRNDSWLNSHIRSFTEVWQANTDWQLIVDIGKVADYMTKYVTKNETISTKNFSRMIARIMSMTSADGSQIDSISKLKRVMAKLQDQRQISCHECCHLLNNLAIVKCDHTFVTVSLENETNYVTLTPTQARTQASSEDVMEETEAVLMSLVDAYANRLNNEIWGNPDNDYVELELFHMTLFEFSLQFYVPRSGGSKGLVMPHRSMKVVPQFYPTLSHIKGGKDYERYCRFSLMKHKAWKGKFEVDLSNAVEEWEYYLKELESTGRAIPDSLAREIHRSKLDAQARRKEAKKNHHDESGDDESGPEELDDPVDPSAPGSDDWMDLGEFAAEHIAIEDDDAEYDMTWNADHDWSELQNEYSPDFREKLLLEYHNVTSQCALKRRTQEVDSKTLNAEQLFALRSIKDALMNLEGHENKTDFHRLCILRGVGGTGKSHTMNALITLFVKKYGFDEDFAMFMATTGAAARLIDGTTVHDHTAGLAIPCSEHPYIEMKGAKLKAFRKWLANKKLIVVDEFSMLRPGELYYIDKRLREGTGRDIPFGGLVVVLCGDPGQLPPVASDSCLWSKHAKKSVDRLGCNLYSMFESSVNLVQNNRVDKSDPDSIFFTNFLLRLRDGKVTEDDWMKLKTSCSKSAMGSAEWERRGFNSDDAIHLFPTNAKVNEHNQRRLQCTKNPIVQIKAEHNCARARSLIAKCFRGLETLLYLAVGAKVMLCMNIAHPAGLVNGATGIVIDIVFEEGQTDAENLPSFVIVDFGEQYKGPNLFGGDESRRGWVPIPALEFDYSVPDLKEPSKYKHVTRKQIPLRLAYAFTIHKAQGQTFRDTQIVMDLGKKEISTGMSYVAMSRATRLSQIGFIGALTLSRITDKISRMPFLKVRLAEEARLDELELVTRSRLQVDDSLAGEQEEDIEEEQATNPFGEDNEGSEEEQAFLKRMFGPDEDSDEEEDPMDEQATHIIPQLPINDHSTREERIAFFRQREIASMERILKADELERILKAKDFHIVVPETLPFSSWLESISNDTEKEELTPLRLLDHRLLRIDEVHEDHCILDMPSGAHFKLPYRLTQWAFVKLTFPEIAQLLETDLLGKQMPVQVVLMSEDSIRTLPIVATRFEIARIMEWPSTLKKPKWPYQPDIIRPLARKYVPVPLQ
jgi:hypothetical protein